MSVALGSRSSIPPGACFCLRPPSGGSEQQLHQTHTKRMSVLGMPSHHLCITKAPLSPENFKNCILYAFFYSRRATSMFYTLSCRLDATVYILLDLVRKSLSCGAVTLGQESQGRTASGFSPNSDVPDHTPRTPCSPKQTYYALVMTIAFCSVTSAEGLPAQL